MIFFRIFFKYFLFFSVLIPITTLANNIPSLLTNGQYSVGVDLGVVKPSNLGYSTTFPLGYSTFSYGSNNNNVWAPISGIAINKKITIDSLYTMQIGFSFHYLSKMDAKGDLEQGISTPYYQSTYSYSIDSFQYLVDAKLRRQFYNRFFPYVYLGLGLASNRAYNFSTAVPDYLTVTPNYSNKTTNSFSYSLGLGVDYFVKPKISLGLGYRFTNLGQTGLGSGAIRNTNVGTKLTQSNLYINALLAQLTYFI